MYVLLTSKLYRPHMLRIQRHVVRTIERSENLLMKQKYCELNVHSITHFAFSKYYNFLNFFSQIITFFTIFTIFCYIPHPYHIIYDYTLINSNYNSFSRIHHNLIKLAEGFKRIGNLLFVVIFLLWIPLTWIYPFINQLLQ